MPDSQSQKSKIRGDVLYTALTVIVKLTVLLNANQIYQIETRWTVTSTAATIAQWQDDRALKYFHRPKRIYKKLLRRTITNKDLVKAGDFIYYNNPDSWDAAPIVIEKYKLIFFTLPKCGCTVWKQLFRRMMGYSDWSTQDGETTFA
jgi:hypothetical protein